MGFRRMLLTLLFFISHFVLPLFLGNKILPMPSCTKLKRNRKAWEQLQGPLLLSQLSRKTGVQLFKKLMG